MNIKRRHFVFSHCKFGFGAVMKQLLIFPLFFLFASGFANQDKLAKRTENSNFRGKDYVFGVGKMNWFAADSYCEQLNMKLISLDTKEKDDEFFDLLKFHGMEGRYVWLAGNCLEDEETYRWGLRGPLVSYTNWSPGQPDFKNSRQHCMKSFIANKWDDDNCFNHRYVICENKPL